jgi:hypothetical protein
MSSPLQLVVEAVADKLGGLTGIKGCPDSPPDQINMYPFIVIYAATGDITGGSLSNNTGIMKGLHNIAIELHIARKNLAYDILTAMQYSDSIPNALWKDPTLNGTASTFGNISYTFSAMNWGGIDTVGFRFIMEEVKVEKAIT